MAAALLALAPVAAAAQLQTPSPYNDSAASPCPEALIEQKYDHVGTARYVAQGWDTVTSCDVSQIHLTAHPYIPVQMFNGTYLVERVPYNPPDPSYWLDPSQEDFSSSVRVHVPASTDDAWMSRVQIPNDLHFYFFGIRKQSFVPSTNGIMSFASGNISGFCHFNTTPPIPWPSSPASSAINPMDEETSWYRDAIYGIYQDTDPRGGSVTGNQGVWYGIIGEAPCRKLILSNNEMPWFTYSENLSNRQTYQIVCYEGSNIVEVHVKRRRRSISTNSWCNYALIGIQNATGNPQVQNDDHTAPNGSNDINGKPAAFWPVLSNGHSANTLTDDALDTISFRFTPQGSPTASMKWYRLLDDGDSVELSTTLGDPDGYCLTENYPGVYPSLNAWVKPTVPTRYMLSIMYNSGSKYYWLHDTIFIGVDTSKSLRIDAISGTRQANGSHTFAVCQGSTTECPLRYTEIQTPRNINWRVKRIYNGEQQDLPAAMVQFNADSTQVTLRPDDRYDTMPENKIDTLYLFSSVRFTSGCNNYDSLLVLVYPNFDITVDTGICQGEVFRWDVDGQNYYATTREPAVTLTSTAGCDSVMRLNLTVFGVDHLVDTVTRCEPYTWPKNGVTYNRTNSSTFATDTVHEQNQYGCDNIRHLQFTLHALTPRIKSDLDFFDYDHLSVNLMDISIGNDRRLWLLPDGRREESRDVVYTLDPEADIDTANINLIAYSPYGCVDTALLQLPFFKETMWLPNAFTPSDPDRNNRFGSRSVNTKVQEMYIYNRRGELVYQCEGEDCTWDGRRSDGTLCPQDAYVYLIRYTDRFQTDKIRVKKGTVTLIR